MMKMSEKKLKRYYGPCKQLWHKFLKRMKNILHDVQFGESIEHIPCIQKWN